MVVVSCRKGARKTGRNNHKNSSVLNWSELTAFRIYGMPLRSKGTKQTQLILFAAAENTIFRKQIRLKKKKKTIPILANFQMKDSEVGSWGEHCGDEGGRRNREGRGQLLGVLGRT